MSRNSQCLSPNQRRTVHDTDGRSNFDSKTRPTSAIPQDSPFQIEASIHSRRRSISSYKPVLRTKVTSKGNDELRRRFALPQPIVLSYSKQPNFQVGEKCQSQFPARSKLESYVEEDASMGRAASLVRNGASELVQAAC